MKKFKLVLIVTALVFTSCLLTGCGKDNKDKEDTNNNKEKTVAQTLVSQFEDEIKKEKDIEKVAKKLSENKVLEIQLDVSTVKKGDYVSGFKTEIKDFNSSVVIRPIIGSIPFVAYIFEVDNPEEFSKNLKENADLRWNICTEADNMEISIVDNYVFFIMSPENLEQE